MQTAAEYIAQLIRSFDVVLNEVSTIASTLGLPRHFLTLIYLRRGPQGLTTYKKKLYVTCKIRKIET